MKFMIYDLRFTNEFLDIKLENLKLDFDLKFEICKLKLFGANL